MKTNFAITSLSAAVMVAIGCARGPETNTAFVSIRQIEASSGTTVRAAYEIADYGDEDGHETKLDDHCTFVRFDLRPDERKIDGVFERARFTGALLPREGLLVTEGATPGGQRVTHAGRGWNGGETLVAEIDGFGLAGRAVDVSAPSSLQVTLPSLPADESLELAVKRGSGDLRVGWTGAAPGDVVEVRFDVSQNGIEAAVVCVFEAVAGEGRVADRGLAMLPATDGAEATFAIQTRRQAHVQSSDWHVVVSAINQPVRRGFRWQ